MTHNRNHRIDLDRRLGVRMTRARLIKRRLRFAWQKVTRGFTDGDLWGLNSVLIDFILPRFAAFRRMRRMSWPGGFDTPDEWEAVLEQIEWALRFHKNDCDYSLYPTLTPEQCEDKAAEGMRLFGKYLPTLWD